MKKYLSLAFIAAVLASVSCVNQEEQLPLAADFVADRTDITIGDKVVFSDISSGTPSKWIWTFEGADIETAVTSSPEVTYSQAGSFSVTLKVVRGKELDEMVKSGFITVNYPGTVTADFEANLTVCTTYDEIRLTDLSTGCPNSWEWTLTDKNGKSFTSSEQNPRFTLDAGVYSVKLVASSPMDSDIREKQDYITVIDKYAVSADFTAKSCITYAGGKISFQDASLGEATGWEWKFEGGTPAISTLQNPEITYSQPGLYKASLTVKNDKQSSDKVVENFIQVIPSDKLVMLSPFDGDSNDAGPYSLNAISVTVGNGGEITYDGESRNGKGSAVYFNSKDVNNLNYLRVPDELMLNRIDATKDYSFSMWGKFPDGLASTVTFFLMGRGTNDPGDGKNGQCMARFSYGPTAATNNFTFLTRDQNINGANVANWCQYTGKITDGQWHHYVNISKVVNDKRVDYIYIDGEKVVEKESAPHTVLMTPFLIGTSYAFVKSGGGVWTIQDRYLGYIDDFIVYNRSLTEDEIKTLADK